MQLRTLTPRKNSKDRQTEQKIKQINSYIQNRIMPVFGPLQIELLTKQPANIKEHCIQWLKKYNHNQNDDPKELFSDEEQEEVFLDKRKKKLRNRRRKGVSGDSTQIYNTVTPEVEKERDEVNWSEETKISILVYLKKCIFFEHLSHQDLLKLISKVRSRTVEKDEIVLREGESGNNLYIVLEGRFKCEKEGNSEIIKEYKAGEVFGELSLLYNHPRASTITALTDGRLCQLDRQEFNLVLRTKMIQKLRECENLVDRIEFFKDLDIFQRTKLFETLEESRIGPDKYIIKEGEMGNCFYIVAEGQLVAYKFKNGENKLVYAYKKGDYFGEIALLQNIPRQASIKTLTQTRLYFINRETFMKLIGPLQGILSRSCERYAIWGGELSGQGQI